MKAEIKKKWVEALRSGKYAQTRGVLTRKKAGFGYEPGHCCLGVLCEVMTDCVTKVGENEDTYCSLYHYKGNDELDTMETGLTLTLLSDIEIPPENQRLLIDLNDTQKKSFSEIADWIEGNL